MVIEFYIDDATIIVKRRAHLYSEPILMIFFLSESCERTSAKLSTTGGQTP